MNSNNKFKARARKAVATRKANAAKRSAAAKKAASTRKFNKWWDSVFCAGAK